MADNIDAAKLAKLPLSPNELTERLEALEARIAAMEPMVQQMFFAFERGLVKAQS